MIQTKSLSTFLFLVFIGSFLFSCKAKKIQIVKELPKTITIDSIAEQKSNLIQQIIESKTNPETVSFNADVDLTENNKSVSLNLEIAIKKNNYIFINAKALGFVNVARVMIQPDSIRILDFINRRYISASYNYLKSFTNAPIGFEQLQNLAFGNALFDPNELKTKVDSSSGQLSLFTILGNTRQKANYALKLKTEEVLLTEQGNSREMQIKFANRIETAGISYPNSILINIVGEKKMVCKFTISNFANNIKKEPQFVVPKSYKVQVY